MLMLRQTKKPAHHANAALPVLSFAFPRQDAKPTSNNPAMMSMIQFISLYLKGEISYPGTDSGKN
jgi:hypothetical protein